MSANVAAHNPTYRSADSRLVSSAEFTAKHAAVRAAYFTALFKPKLSAVYEAIWTAYKSTNESHWTTNRSA